MARLKGKTEGNTATLPELQKLHPLNFPVLKTLASLYLPGLELKARISQPNRGSDITTSPLPVATMYHNLLFFPPSKGSMEDFGEPL